MMSFFVDSSIDYGYTSQPESRACGSSQNLCSSPRGKVMGGSGSINYLQFVRGNKRDYDDWESLGNEGWNWDNVLPYFRKLENFKIPEVINFCVIDESLKRRGGCYNFFFWF